MSDDDVYRGTVDPLGALVRRFERGKTSSTERVLATGGASIVVGDLVLQLGLGMVAAAAGGLIAIGVALRTIRAPRGGVDLHASGVRLRLEAEVTIRWEDLAALRIGFTPDQRTRDGGGLELVTAQGEHHIVASHLPDVEGLAAAIEQATAVRLRKRIDETLDRGDTIPFGKHHFDAEGLRTAARHVPWAELGPARRAKGCFIVAWKDGPFEVVIGTLDNPGPLAAVIGARGRP